MWQIFVVYVFYVIKWALKALFSSFKLAWGLLKWEGYLITASYRRYPIGFFAFFIHFVGFWLTAGYAEFYHKNYLMKLYTLGIFDDLGDYGNSVVKIFDLLACIVPETSNSNGLDEVIWETILAIVAMLFFIWLMIPVVVIFLNLLFFSFPIIHAILTQLILGIPFRGFVLRWREKHDKDLWEEDEYEEYEDVHSNRQNTIYKEAQVSSARNNNIQIGSDTTTEDGLKLSSVTIKEDKGPQYREFDETYHNVKKRIDDYTFKLYHVHEQLIEKRGKNDSLEKMYAQTISMHNEMQQVYKKAYDTVCFTNDYEAIKECYAELKKEMIRVKNAQANLAEAMKKVYGVQV